MKWIISLITRLIPRHILQKVAHYAMIVIAPFYHGDEFEDPIDGKTYRKLLPYGQRKRRANALAPYSMSLERHRLIWIYLKKRTDLFSTHKSFLHVAPEYCFIRKFKAMKNLHYVTGDLNSPWADVKMDVRNIPFKDNTFDVAMCNHVFEHVAEDRKAMAEFYRVLRPGGWAIFQVPIDVTRQETYEDLTITEPMEREKHFWQRDHVRLYGLDYAERLASVGFEVDENDFIKEIGEDLSIRYALPQGEILYVCHKPLK